MNLLGLSVRNVLRIRQLDLEFKPEGGVVLISGRNGQGKTSAMNALVMALGGKSLQPPRPVRDGATEAEVVAKLGGPEGVEYIVTRHWTSNTESYLSVKTPNGASVPQPQGFLASLASVICFDPLAFSRERPAVRRSTLLRLAGVDVDERAHARQGLEEIRRDLGRELKRLEGALSTMPAPAPGLGDDPDALQERSVTELSSKLSAAQAHNAEVTAAERRTAEIRDMGIRLAREVEAKKAALERAAEDVRMLEEELQKLRADYQAADAALAGMESVDTTPILADMASIEQVNARIRETRQTLLAQRAVIAARGEWEAADRRVKEHDAKLLADLGAAKLPVPGLAVDADDVSVGGIPFEQLASSMKVRVSAAVGMALNPRLRLMLIGEGNRLDKDSLGALEKLAEEQGFQVLMEVVDESQALGVVIEDGAVLSIGPGAGPARAPDESPKSPPRGRKHSAGVPVPAAPPPPAPAAPASSAAPAPRKRAASTSKPAAGPEKDGKLPF